MPRPYLELKIIDLPKYMSCVKYIPLRPTDYEVRKSGAYVFELIRCDMSNPLVLCLNEAVKFKNLAEIPPELMKLTDDTVRQAPFAVLAQKGVKQSLDAKSNVLFVG